ncbi:MAG TPA: ABC transporter substrate-binding protein [Candidatus Levybacteria bacterium]|nr:ABC transporter substrate-binding protein [Candidatus Levybacteria bacterium]
MRTLRKRYYFWLVKAYIKRWKRTILTSLIIGIIISGSGILLLNFYIRPSLDNKIQRIGVFGIYTPENLPENIISDVSYGLTAITENGSIKPAAAQRWEVKQDGKEYVFYLKKNLVFHNGDVLNAHTLPLSFKDAQKNVIDDYTVSYLLDAPYSPFLATVAKPILHEDFSGLGNYILRDIELNAGYIQSLVLQDKNDRLHKKILYFYPTQAALKTAYMLGEVDQVSGVLSPQLEDKNLSTWSNTTVEKKVNYDQLVTLFYNNADSNLSNKKYRQALNYALPESFSDGQRAFSPIPPNSMYFAHVPNFGISDIDIAREVLQTSGVPSDHVIEITTTTDLEETAHDLSKQWEKAGIKSRIKVIDEVHKLAPNFHVLLYKYRLPVDPDQYTFWHSDQVNNIGKYKNLRIDKLLEDGRLEIDSDERITIYADFQKYLLDDVPASFLYFPMEYTITRK